MKVGDPLPSFDGATQWLDIPASPAQLCGHPVLVHFWSTGCPLCHDGASDIASWRARFSDLVVIATYQARPDETIDVASVTRDARESMNIEYPCAIDAAGTLARSFDNTYPPGYYLFDAEHRLCHRQMGNVGFDVIESILQRLLVKASPEPGAY